MKKHQIHTTKAFEKDLKLMKKRNKNISKLKQIAELLEAGIALAAKHRPHKLSGNWNDHWECHVEPDWLLIWRYDKTDLILVRTGTHSDLF